MSFIGIPINHETARLIHEIDVPGERVDSARFHITLLHLGNDLPIETIAKAMIATYQITQKTSPFWVKLNNLASFPVEEGQRNPIIAKACSSKLNELHTAIKKSFDRMKIGYDRRYKTYVPHITLSFNDAAIKQTKIEPIEWSVQELVLYGGENGDDRVFSTFPLEIKKNCEVECQEK